MPETAASVKTKAIGRRPVSGFGMVIVLAAADDEPDDAAPAPVTVGEEVTVPVPKEPAWPRSFAQAPFTTGCCNLAAPSKSQAVAALFWPI